jgi:hypothetical protein
MLEPFEKSEQDVGKVKIDRAALNSTLKSWLMPGSTGTLNQAGVTEEIEKKKPENIIYLGDGISKNT